MHISFSRKLLLFFALIFRSIADSNYGSGAWDASSSPFSSLDDGLGNAMNGFSKDEVKDREEALSPIPQNRQSPEILLSASDECKFGDSYKSGKMRLRRYNCEEFMPRPGKDRDLPSGDERIAPSQPRIDPPSEPDLPAFAPLIRTTRLDPNEKICPRPFLNVPVCDTGKKLVAYPIVPSRFHFNLPQCHPWNAFYGCLTPEILWCCAIVVVNLPDETLPIDLYTIYSYTGYRCVLWEPQLLDPPSALDPTAPSPL